VEVLGAVDVQSLGNTVADQAALIFRGLSAAAVAGITLAQVRKYTAPAHSHPPEPLVLTPAFLQNSALGDEQLAALSRVQRLA